MRELTPETSYGFDFIEFCELIGFPLDPWEQWVAIHLGELLENGIPRFRFALILVARQNGKTVLCRLLTLYWMFIECHPIIFGVSASRETAKFSWREVMKMAETIEILSEQVPPNHSRGTTGEEVFWNRLGSSYRFGAPNSRAGRSFTVNRAIMDELREHRNRDAYNALIPAGNAVADFQVVAITNQGDDSAVVLDTVRNSALEFIETGTGDSRLFMAEYSSPAGSDVIDPVALSYANPNLNRRISLDALMGQAIQAKKKGGKALADFKTENMCMKVHSLDPAIEPELWAICGFPEDKTYPNLAEHRRSVALCLDVSLSGDHATLVAVAEIEGFLYCEVVKVWFGFNCTAQVKQELPELAEKIKPRAFGWYPGGPAAAIAADLKAKPSYNKPWPPRNVKVVEFNSESIPSICMGLANTIHSAQMYHPRDEMLTTHVKQTQKLHRQDVWTFTRSGEGSVDGTYALAGALHLARSLPAPLKPVTTGREEAIPF